MRACDRIVPEVMRTAAMPERAKKTHKLMEHPILGHTSQMWEFFLQELKDIADVADLFPETRTAVELALALPQDAVNMVGRDETVDARASVHLLTALYFINIRPGTGIPEAAYGDILADVARVRAVIQGVHGASPGLRLVEKTDYYGWLVMFMLANAVNKAFSEMSDKSWLESNLLLDSALRVCRGIYGHVFKDVVVFINGGELGGATTASWHAHLLETLDEAYIRALPASGDQHLITQEDFARLRRRRLDGALIQDFLCDVATENLLQLGDSLPKSQVPPAHAPFVARIRHLAEELANPAIDADFADILAKLSKADIRNPFGAGPRAISALDFLGDARSDYLFPPPPPAPAGKKKGGDLALAERKRLFCRHVANYRRKLAFWERHGRTVTLSPATEILSGAVLAHLDRNGLSERIRSAIRDSRTLPDGVDIRVEVVSDIRSMGGDQITPEIRFAAPPRVWSLYGKEVCAIAEGALNDWWGAVFDIATDTLARGPAPELLARLDGLFGLTGYFGTLKWRTIPFEREPGALDYGAGRHARLEEIGRTVENYLVYFLACFARAARHSKKSGLHKRSLCPRNTAIRLERAADGTETRITIIRPMLAYKPLMPVAAFDTLLGPAALLSEANARFERVELGGKSWIVQKMGGEDLLFQRDKRKRHYGGRYRRQQGEREFIGGINEVMKTRIMDEACLGAVDDLYHLYYVREHCANTGADVRAMVRAPAADALVYADREMDKVRRRHQDKEHGFLQYKRVEQRLRPLRGDARFNRLLDAAGLPEHKILRDHIAQILAVREIERAPLIRRGDPQADEAAERARAALLEDDLDTIIFFRLAERMVGHAFARVAAARESEAGAGAGNQRRAILRDTRNSSFLLADTVARLLYRHVAAHERKEEFHDAMRRHSLDGAFFAGMTAYVVKGLAFSGYKTREFWELEGAPVTDGYAELFQEHPLPAAAIEDVIGGRAGYVPALAQVLDLLAVCDMTANG